MSEWGPPLDGEPIWPDPTQQAPFEQPARQGEQGDPPPAAPAYTGPPVSQEPPPYLGAPPPHQWYQAPYQPPPQVPVALRRPASRASLIAVLAVLVAIAAGFAVVLASNRAQHRTASSPGSAGTTLPGITIPQPSLGISGLPDLSAMCTAVADVPYVPATAYVLLAMQGSVDIAQTCVYRDDVPRAVTESLSGKDLAPDAGSLGGNGPFRYTGPGVVVTVTVTREADGRYYVTHVTVS
jgi:hypothetical protein